MNWSEEEITFLTALGSPVRIQDFLDSIDYNPNPECRSPRWVMKKRSAHCFEGALFAASALRFHGFRPLIVDMKAHNDDDHVIAVYQVDGHWGAVAKSNFTTLRFREPVYRTVRELVMSYFDFYFNLNGDKSLRSFCRPLDLTRYDALNWERTDEDLEYIGDKLETLHHYDVISRKMIGKLTRASDIMLRAGMLGSNEAGLFKPV
ncbi:MAG: hypothetical protein MUD02_07895 [Bacteroidales bacterium]|jgi:hypothetical protein|nr:hypothetical protein [Bacteroidales bacterium]MCU0408854.1 hypothetical protein [Bacteroidales bacterium]